jgi:hypothetical protein
MNRLTPIALFAALACASSAPPASAPDGAGDQGADAAAIADGAAIARDGATSSDAALAADAGGSDAAAPLDAAPPSDAMAASGWPAVVDYGARGPYHVTWDKDTGPGGAYDVFRPAPFEAQRKHPIISWANGTLFGITDYQRLLEHWASHGFVVIAGHTNSTAGGGSHKAGIDWLVAENARSGSPYFGVLDATKIGAAGHSQGGGATIAAGADKPGHTGIVTVLPLMPLLSFEKDTTIVRVEKTPMLNINASMDDRDPTGAVANQIFGETRVLLVQASFIGKHEDAMGPAMLRPTLAWFRLQLMGDQAARSLFFPFGTCGLCQDPAWKQVRQKNVQ